MNEITYIGYVLGPEFGADEHYAYQVTITPGLMDRIAGLSAEIKRLDIFSAQFFDSSVRVFRRWPMHVPHAIFHGGGQPEEIEEDEDLLLDDIEVYPACLQVYVYADGDFSWSWYPKHGGRHERCDTDSFCLEFVRQDIQQRSSVHSFPELSRA